MTSFRFRALLTVLCLATAAGPAPGQTLPGRPRPDSLPPGSLPFSYGLYTFRGDHGGTLVVAAVAVEARWLKRKEIGGRGVYRFNVSFVLADTTTRSIFRTDDSVSVAAPRPLADDHLLYTQVAVEAPPSASTVERVVMTDPNAVGYGHLYDSAFPVPDYSGSDLMLSDIALGQPDPEGGLDRRGHRIAILPLARLPKRLLDLYYEIYNMPLLAPYTTEVTFLPIDAAGRAEDTPVGTRFEGRAPAEEGRTIRELRGIRVDLDPGLYRLTVTVRTGRTGETASRSRVFEVRKSRSGASLVVARPRR